MSSPLDSMQWSKSQLTQNKDELESVSHCVMCESLQPHRLQPPRLLCPWESPGKNTGVGCHVLLQGIFPIQGSDLAPPHLLLWQMLGHLGSDIN